jgi:hypothetical protein
LTQSHGFVVKHLRWIPHSLTPTQKAEHVILLTRLLRQLPAIEHYKCEFIITRDESWFYLSTDHEHLWLCAEEQSPERPRHIIQGSK